MSLPRRPSKKFSRRPGVLLLEAALGTGLLVIFLSALGVTVYRGQEGTKAGGDRIRATELAKQTLEGARDIGMRSYLTLTGALVGGTRGVALNPTTGLWEFSGAETVTNDYTTKLTVTKPDPTDQNTLDLSVTTSWNISPNRPQSVTITGRFTNWQQNVVTGNWTSIVELGQYQPGALYTTNYTDVAVIGTHAYVANSAVNGLVTSIDVLNFSNLSSITRVETIDLPSGETPVALAARGNLLYVITTSAGGSYVHAFDVSVPTSIGAAIATATIPVAAGMNATSIAINGDYLYVGAK